MEDQELSRVEEGLRTIMAEAGLSWVLSQLNEEISYGVVEHRTTDEYEPRRASKASMLPEWTDEASAAGDEGRSSRVRMTNRPQTVRERVMSLLSALERVAIELPNIEQDVVVRLTGVTGVTVAPRDTQAAVRSIRFFPDEDMIDSETFLKRASDEDEQRRLALRQLLTTLEEEEVQS